MLEVKIIKKQTLEVFSAQLKELNNRLKELEEKEKIVRNEFDVIYPYGKRVGGL